MTAPTTSTPQDDRRLPAPLPAIGVGVLVWFAVFALGYFLFGFHAIWPALLVGVGTGAWLWFRADATVLQRSGAVAADPHLYPRFHNVADGLCVAAGGGDPGLYVVEDPALNAFAVGRDPRRGALVVTTGLLEALDRMELEAVIAHLVALIRDDAMPASTMAAAVPFAPSPAALAAGHHARADLAAVALTRYPPGLIAALEKLESGGSVLQRDVKAGAHLWVAPPVANAALETHQPLAQRIATLREL